MRKTKRVKELESANLIADRLSALMENQSDNVPKGFKSAEELSKKEGCSSRRIMDRLNKLASSGKVEKVKLLIQTGDGRRLTSFYKI
jgi:hypothetical protein